MSEQEKALQESSEENTERDEQSVISEEWAHENIEALDEFIESQGIYLRQ